jgi:hypothetical protein
MIGAIQIPDFAGTIMRGQQFQQQGQLSRLQLLAAQQAYDDAQAYRAAASEILPQLATADGETRLGLLGRLAASSPRGAELALPLIQQERERVQGADLIRSVIPGAVQPTGDYYGTLRQVESGGDNNAVNPRSTATGPYQFIDSTWRAFAAANPEIFAGMSDAQIMQARTDPRIARLGAEWLTRQNAQELQRAGLPASPVTAYLAHVFGAGDAAKLLRADPNAPVETLLSPQVIAANPQLRGQTAGSVVAQAGQRFGGAPSGNDPSGASRGRGLPSPQQLMMLLASGNQAARQFAQGVAPLVAQANPNWTSVSADGQVFMVNPQNPSQRVRIGDANDMAVERIRNPDGSSRIVARRDAIGQTEAAAPPDTFARANTLRDEFQALTREFRVVRDAYANIETAARSQTGAGDMAMLYSFVKLLDPNSVVRESEFATAAASGSFGERVQGAVQRIINGERLPDSLRNAFLAEARNIYQTQERGYRNTEQTYRALAERNNLDPENVITPFLPSREAASPSGASGQTGVPFPGGGRAEPPPAAQPPVRVRTPEEARRLPRGTPILLPDGTIGRVP